MEIFLPNSAHLVNVQGFIRKCRFDDPTSLRVRFHERWVSVHPVGIALTAAAARAVKEGGGTVSVDLPAARHASFRYLAAMGLFDVLGCAPPVPITPHEPAGRFIRLTQIRTSSELTSFMVDMVPLLHADMREIQPIQYVISELVRNVLEHSSSSTGAFLCAQYYKNKRTLALGVADCGVGVKASLTEYYHPATDLAAIMLALRPGVTGAPRGAYGPDNNAGAGLFFTKSIACASNNQFVVLSGSGFFKLKKTPAAHREIVIQADPARDYNSTMNDLPPWPGTVVGIDVAIDKGKTFAQLLTAIRNVYGIERSAARKRKYKGPRFS